MNSCLVAALLVLGLVAPSVLGEGSDFTLRHVELKAVKLNVENGSMTPGKALITDINNGIVFYRDNQFRLRTRTGDYCVNELNGFLSLGACSDDSFQYVGSDGFYSIIQPSRHVYATWQNENDQVDFSGRKFLTHPESDKNLRFAFGAGWQKTF